MVHRRSSGFTVIEIVLVLAIVGVIFWIIFIAIPAAQRTARDQQRRGDLGQLVGIIEDWRLNHQGNHIDNAGEFAQVTSKFNETHKEPLSGTNYQFQFREQGEAHLSIPPPVGRIVYSVAHVCGSDPDEETLVTIGAEKSHFIRIYSVLLTLESGGVVYCLDNDN